MGLFNYLLLEITCPRCGKTAEMEAEFRFGLMELIQYRVGDQLQWDGPGVKAPPLRPENGNYEGEAYVVCPHCERDFWLVVAVQNNILVGAKIDATREPFISDDLTP